MKEDTRDYIYPLVVPVIACAAGRRRLWSNLGATILILFILSCSDDDTNHPPDSSDQLFLNNVVVEVHKSSDANGLWYHVGTVNAGGKAIDRGHSYQYDDGVNPSISWRKKGSHLFYLTPNICHHAIQQGR